MAGNHHVALLFFWHELERQVRIDGIVSKTSSKMSDDYYYSRPLASRIGAWASSQSQVVPIGEHLESQEKFFKDKFGENPPRPDHWGYHVAPYKIEFWQGRPQGLLMTVLTYTKNEDHWHIQRLAPGIPLAF
jgi:pyridoxamine 5'-phosphate oxidase